MNLIDIYINIYPLSQYHHPGDLNSKNAFQVLPGLGVPVCVNRFLHSILMLESNFDDAKRWHDQLAATASALGPAIASRSWWSFAMGFLFSYELSSSLLWLSRLLSSTLASRLAVPTGFSLKSSILWKFTSSHSTLSWNLIYFISFKVTVVANRNWTSRIKRRGSNQAGIPLVWHFQASVSCKSPWNHLSWIWEINSR